MWHWRRILIMSLIVLIVLVPVLYVWMQRREMQRHERAVKIIEDCGGKVTYESPDTKKSTSLLRYLFGSKWELRTEVFVLGKTPDWPVPSRLKPDLLLAQLRNLRNLDRLCIVGSICNDQLKYLSEIHEVKTLHLAEQVIGPDFQYLKNMVNLRSLIIGKSQISDVDLQHIKNLDSLICLDLYETNVTDEGLKYLKGLTRLKELSLSNTKVTGAGLADLKELTNLEVFVAIETPFNDEGLRHLQQYPRLREVRLRDTKITDAGLEYMRNIHSMEELDLSDTQISDVSLVYLRVLFNLKWFNACNTKVTIIGAEKLHSEIPEATICWGNTNVIPGAGVPVP